MGKKKLKIAQINGGAFGSTGRIMFGIADLARQAGHETFCASAVTATNRVRSGSEDYYRIGSFRGRQLSVLLARITGRNGCFARIATARLLAQLDRFKPDVLQLHTLHNSYINLPMLFRYIKKHQIKTVWSLHDCWAFTGQCPHFAMAGCDKWKTGCHDCPIYRQYPQSLFDCTKTMYRKKKRWFCGVQSLTIVAASNWLAGCIRQSFLRDYPLAVINNGVDLNVFQPLHSDFRKEHGIAADAHLVLGVCFGWTDKKGLDVFLRLASELEPSYRIVLVGTDENIEKLLPSGVISIRRTENQHALAQIYSASDVFVNPTREETFAIVNIEALACGTPVITFDTGGSPESITDACGSVVDCDDVDALKREIRRACEQRPFTAQACRERARDYNYLDKYAGYIGLYEQLSADNPAQR